MFEDSVSTPSIWASMNSWFTPAVLFVLLNLMIGTIFITSSLANQKQQKQAQDDPQQPKLARSPSVLQRLKSFNLHAYRSQEPNPSPPIAAQFKPNPDADTHYPPDQQTHEQQTLETQIQFVLGQTHKQQTLETETQYVFEQTHEEAEVEDVEEDLQTLDEVFSQLNDRHVSRSKSDTKPASGELPEKLPGKMRKSASLKSAFGHFEEEDIVEGRRPATVRERKARLTEVDDEVDAKADDFINKFKQQLKLQRLDSIVRYKEMIGRGSGK